MKQITISLLILLSLLTFSCKKEQNPDGQYYSIGTAIWTFPGDLCSDTPGEYYVKEISQYYLNQNRLGDVLKFANASSITLSGSNISALTDFELPLLTFPQKYCLIANKMVILNKDLSHVSSKGLSHIDSLMFDGAVLKFNGSLSISSVSDLSGFPLICDINYPKRYTDRSSAIKDTTSLSSSGKYKFKDLPIRRLDLSSIQSPIKFTDTFEIKKIWIDIENAATYKKIMGKQSSLTAEISICGADSNAAYPTKAYGKLLVSSGYTIEQCTSIDALPAKMIEDLSRGNLQMIGTTTTTLPGDVNLKVAFFDKFGSELPLESTAAIIPAATSSSAASQFTITVNQVDAAIASRISSMKCILGISSSSSMQTGQYLTLDFKASNN